MLSDGKNILVNDSNKEQYISLILKWRMERNVQEQGKAILRGLYSVKKKLIKINNNLYLINLDY